MDSAPINVACVSWPQVLPVSCQVLRELGWWLSGDGNFIFKRDSYGDVRVCEVADDSPQVLFTWLCDWHRREVLSQSRRADGSWKHSGIGFAQGMNLPAASSGALCIYAGHVASYNQEVPTVRQSALVTGCSAWYTAKKHGLPAPVQCACGGSWPSRPHLMWCCPAFQELRVADAPANHAEERLLARVVSELPAPPTVVDPAGLVEELADDLAAAAARGQVILITTDGSAIDEVGCWAVVREGSSVDFALKIPGEDQTP